MRPREPRTIESLWRHYAPYWHVCMGAVAIIGYCFLWVQNVSAYNGRITQNEKDIAELKLTRQTVNDIAEFLGVYNKTHN